LKRIRELVKRAILEESGQTVSFENFGEEDAVKFIRKMFR